MRIKKIAFFLLFIGAGFAALWQDQSGTRRGNKENIGFEVLKNLDIYSGLIRTHYRLCRCYNPGQLNQTGIDAMLESLDL